MTVFQLNLPEKITAELAAEGIGEEQLNAFLVAAIEVWLAQEQQARSVEEVVAQLVKQVQQNDRPVETSMPVFQRILARAADMGISDLSQRHDYYLYKVVKDEPSQ
jgi:hypothetical protein